MLIRKNSSIKKLQFAVLVSFLLVTTCWGEVLLTNDEIMQIHKKMALLLKEQYTNLPKFFDTFHNLCTARIQLVYKYTDDDEDTFIGITEDRPILKDNNEPIITSSAYTQNIYENTYEKEPKKISEILSWPFKESSILRCINDESNFNKRTKQPTKIYNQLFNGINNNEKCCKALNINLQSYAFLLNPNQQTDIASFKLQLLKNNDPIFYLKENYQQYKQLEFEDIKHAEPLMVWYIERHFEELKSQCIIPIENAEILYPIIHFHTRKQTCSDCEKLIQKSAKKYRYVPVISFSDLYLSKKQGFNCNPCSSQVNGQIVKYFLPFSILKYDFLDLEVLRKLRKFTAPRLKKYYLQWRYPEYEALNKKQNRTPEEQETYNSYLLEKEKLRGIKRFPIQFHIPF